MSEDKEIRSLGQLLDQLAGAAESGDPVSVDAILEAVGRRSFGPVLLAGGLITLAPIVGDIPGVPTIIGALVLLIGLQLLFRSEHIWLPEWLLERSIGQEKVCKVIKWLRRPTRFADRFLRPRLSVFTNRVGTYLMAIVCVMIAAAMPVMELVAFSANGAGAALTAFGLSLVAEDGLLALLAFMVTATTFGLIVYTLI